MSHEALGFPGISASGFQTHYKKRGEAERDSGITLLKGIVQEFVVTIAPLLPYEDPRCLHWWSLRHQIVRNSVQTHIQGLQIKQKHMRGDKLYIIYCLPTH